MTRHRGRECARKQVWDIRTFGLEPSVVGRAEGGQRASLSLYYNPVQDTQPVPFPEGVVARIEGVIDGKNTVLREAGIDPDFLGGPLVSYSGDRYDYYQFSVYAPGLGRLDPPLEVRGQTVWLMFTSEEPGHVTTVAADRDNRNVKARPFNASAEQRVTRDGRLLSTEVEPDQVRTVVSTGNTVPPTPLTAVDLTQQIVLRKLTITKMEAAGAQVSLSDTITGAGAPFLVAYVSRNGPVVLNTDYSLPVGAQLQWATGAGDFAITAEYIIRDLT